MDIRIITPDEACDPQYNGIKQIFIGIGSPLQNTSKIGDTSIERYDGVYQTILTDDDVRSEYDMLIWDKILQGQSNVIEALDEIGSLVQNNIPILLVQEPGIEYGSVIKRILNDVLNPPKQNSRAVSGYSR